MRRRRRSLGVGWWCLVVVVGPAAAAAWSSVSSASSAFASGCASDEVPFPREGDEDGLFDCVDFDKAYVAARDFLVANAPPWDLENKVTLFGLTGAADGLDAGVASLGINTSLGARRRFGWAAAVPRALFHEYVAVYASVNEPRTDWRSLVSRAVTDIVARLPRNATVEAVAQALNFGEPLSVWTAFPGGAITFQAGRTPLVYDAASTIAFKAASCTGVSQVFIAALRAVGVPARLAGTPAWHGDGGNHNWVEIYTAASWKFIEARPAGGPHETLDDPCDKWFCDATRFASEDRHVSRLLILLLLLLGDDDDELAPGR